jgi:hypothetical protein
MQLGWSPTHGHVRDFADHTVTDPGLGTAPTTEIVAVYDATFQRGLVVVEMLTGDRHAEITEHAKGVKIWAREGRLGHVEVFLSNG